MRRQAASGRDEKRLIGMRVPFISLSFANTLSNLHGYFSGQTGIEMRNAHRHPQLSRASGKGGCHVCQ